MMEDEAPEARAEEATTSVVVEVWLLAGASKEDRWTQVLLSTGTSVGKIAEVTTLVTISATELETLTEGCSVAGPLTMVVVEAMVVMLTCGSVALEGAAGGPG